MELFPIYLNLHQRTCLVVGGGSVAARKITHLLQCGAMVTVVAPEVEEGIAELAREGKIIWKPRGFVESDLEEIFLVFSATDDEGLNHRISMLCQERNIPINVVDDPQHCSFFVPAVVRRGSLSLAISTAGKSPMYARKLKEQLQEIVTAEYGEFVEMLGEVREEVKRAYPEDIDKRREIFKSLVYSDILELLLAGEKDEAKERIKACISSLPD